MMYAVAEADEKNPAEFLVTASLEAAMKYADDLRRGGAAVEVFKLVQTHYLHRKANDS